MWKPKIGIDSMPRFLKQGQINLKALYSKSKVRWPSSLCQLLMVPITLVTPYAQPQIDKAIGQLYQQVPKTLGQNTAVRVAYFSDLFLGKPYQLFPLGEGPLGVFDQNPLYRTDRFDCMTYVTTVLALAKGHDLASFQQAMLALNYGTKAPRFENRHHFTESDWNQSNEAQGFLQDLTPHLNHVGPVLYLSLTLNKSQWFKELPAQRIQLLAYPGDQVAWERWQDLKYLGKGVKNQTIQFSYLPASVIWSRPGQLNPSLFDQLPTGTILEIVRPHWNMRPLIGSDLAISHMGFLIRESGQIYFREASSDKGRVVDLPLGPYLARLAQFYPIGLHVEGLVL